MAGPSPTEYRASLLSELCTKDPSLCSLLQIFAGRQRASHYALVERPLVVSSCFTVASDVVNFETKNPHIFAGLRRPLYAEWSDSDFEGISGVRSILSVPISDSLFVVLVNPSVAAIPPDILAITQLAIRRVYELTECDADYSTAVVDSFTDDFMSSIGSRSFSVADFHPSAALLGAFAMFYRSGICTRVGIGAKAMLRFVLRLRHYYNSVPYHNWFHALDALEFVYSVYRTAALERFFDAREIFALLLSAICHDTGHDGYNNSFQRNARTPFAHLAVGLPPLEHHHCCATNDLVGDLLSQLSGPDREFIRHFLIDCIMSTDMEQHKTYMEQFGAIADAFDAARAEHRLLLAQIILKCADLSNVVRDFREAKRMATALVVECRRQGTLEIAMGLKISPMCDPADPAPLCVGQIGFLTFVAGPLMKRLHAFFPELAGNQVQIDENLATWGALKKQWEEERH
jgi:hypothetical protein